jgi:hypothetical protein
VPPFGARFYVKGKQDLGRAARVTARAPRSGSTLTVFDVVGAEPGLARALSFLDQSSLRIHCEDDVRTCYVFRWASGYGNGADVRIQGMLEPEGWTEAITPPKPEPKPPQPPGAAPSWLMGRPKRPW